MHPVIASIRDITDRKGRRGPFLLLCAWTLDAFVSVFVTGFVSVDMWLALSLAVKAVIIAVNIVFLLRMFAADDSRFYPYLKNFAGYGIILVYVAYALPRLSWRMHGFISVERALTLWGLSVNSALFPLALYATLWYPGTRKAWGIALQDRTDTAAVRTKKSVIAIVLENANIVLQAIIIVIVIQHFVFQPYLIPSESMVPTFLINDRPFVTKLQSGPAVPLSDLRLPVLVEPKRGSIVVFENPNVLSNDLTTVVFQHFVFLATLSMVDIDPQKRFIVKRVIAGEGEKVMMVDDVLYTKRAGEASFSRCDDDVDFYAHTNLHEADERTRKRIIHLPIDAETRALLDKWDRVKNNATIASLADKAERLRARITGGITDPERSALAAVFTSDRFFQGPVGENIARVFEKYVQRRAERPARQDGTPDAYTESSKKTNLLFQVLVLEKIDALLALMRTGLSLRAAVTHPSIAEFDAAISGLAAYIIDFYDRRNFPQFPSGEDEFIPEGEFFLLGDNRYNSHDFRFGEERYMRRLDADDPFSFVYDSNMAPHTLDERKILGFVLFRMWPPDRFGIVR